MIKIAAAAALAAVTLGACAQLSEPPEPTVTVTERATPTPTQDYTDSSEFRAFALEYAFGELSLSAQEEMCDMYRIAPDVLWAAWSSQMDTGSDTGLASEVTRSDFDKFFSKTC